uniref:(northern house mosquito) hypothetical protein n=1 Tax=Culex pipiens TaxID=7175 RepID=A0A8D8JBN0_CULPI
MRRSSWPRPVWRPCWEIRPWPSTRRTIATSICTVSSSSIRSATGGFRSCATTLWRWTLERVPSRLPRRTIRTITRSASGTSCRSSRSSPTMDSSAEITASSPE